MERRGLNIRKGFLKAVLPVFRALPLPVASRFVSGIGRLEYRLSASLGSRSTPQSRRDEPFSTETGTHGSQPRAGGESCALAHPRLAARRGPRPAGFGHVYRSGKRASGCRDGSGEGMHRAGKPLRGPPSAGALAAFAKLSGSVLHGATAAYFAVHVAAFSDGRAARAGQAVHLAAGGSGRLGQLDPACGAGDQGGAAALPGRRRALDWKADRDAQFLGRKMRFSTTWVVLAAMTEAPVVMVFCRMEPDGRYHIEFRPAFLRAQGRRRAESDGGLGPALHRDSGRAGAPASRPTATSIFSGASWTTRLHRHHAAVSHQGGTRHGHQEAGRPDWEDYARSGRGWSCF